MLDTKPNSPALSAFSNCLVWRVDPTSTYAFLFPVLFLFVPLFFFSHFLSHVFLHTTVIFFIIFFTHFLPNTQTQKDTDLYHIFHSHILETFFFLSLFLYKITICPFLSHTHFSVCTLIKDIGFLLYT